MKSRFPFPSAEKGLLVSALLILFAVTASAGCRTAGFSGWTGGDTMFPSLGFNTVPPQSEPPLPQDGEPADHEDG